MVTLLLHLLTILTLSLPPPTTSPLSPPPPSPSRTQLLQLSHLHRSVECEHYLASATGARDKLSQLKTQVDQLFSEAHLRDSAGVEISRY